MSQLDLTVTQIWAPMFGVLLFPVWWLGTVAALAAFPIRRRWWTGLLSFFGVLSWLYMGAIQASAFLS